VRDEQIIGSWQCPSNPRYFQRVSESSFVFNCLAHQFWWAAAHLGILIKRFIQRKKLASVFPICAMGKALSQIVQALVLVKWLCSRLSSSRLSGWLWLRSSVFTLPSLIVIGVIGFSLGSHWQAPIPCLVGVVHALKLGVGSWCGNCLCQHVRVHCWVSLNKWWYRFV